MVRSQDRRDWMVSGKAAVEGSINDVWDRYKRTGEENLRNRLMEYYLSSVRFIAERIHRKLPREVELDDLISSGLFGLMDAIESFDPSLGYKFETFCAPRIRGAILDELRSLDWVPRLVRTRTGQFDAARAGFEKQHGRSPSEEELLQILQISSEDYEKMRKDERVRGVVSISRKFESTRHDGDPVEVDMMSESAGDDPFDRTVKRDMRDAIIKGLSRAERLIVILYYYEMMTLKEIGATLDLSESRVSQMHHAILARLKAQFQDRLPEIQAAFAA